MCRSSTNCIPEHHTARRILQSLPAQVQTLVMVFCLAALPSLSPCPQMTALCCPIYAKEWHTWGLSCRRILQSRAIACATVACLQTSFGRRILALEVYQLTRASQLHQRLQLSPKGRDKCLYGLRRRQVQRSGVRHPSQPYWRAQGSQSQHRSTCRGLRLHILT